MLLRTPFSSAVSLPNSPSIRWKGSPQVRDIQISRDTSRILTHSLAGTYYLWSVLLSRTMCWPVGLVDDNNLYEWEVMIIGYAFMPFLMPPTGSQCLLSL